MTQQQHQHDRQADRIVRKARRAFASTCVSFFGGFILFYLPGEKLVPR